MPETETCDSCGEKLAGETVPGYGLVMLCGNHACVDYGKTVYVKKRWRKKKEV